MGNCSEVVGQWDTIHAQMWLFGSPTKLDSNILTLKIPHTQVIKHGEIKLVLTWKLRPYRLPYIVLAGTTQAARGEKESSALPAVNE